MKIERTGFVNEVIEMNEGIIYQSNFPGLNEVGFTYFMKDYTDPFAVFSDNKNTVAKFTIKSKLPF
jgi:hypothetical protein